jgi:hypothetical protein
MSRRLDDGRCLSDERAYKRAFAFPICSVKEPRSFAIRLAVALWYQRSQSLENIKSNWRACFLWKWHRAGAFPGQGTALPSRTDRGTAPSKRSSCPLGGPERRVAVVCSRYDLKVRVL